MIIEGNVSVKAAVLGERRHVSAIYVDKDKKDKDTNWILHQAEKRNISVQFMAREEINAMAQGKTHGGLIAEADERKMQSLEELLSTDNPFLMLIEGVEDPFNLGYMIRTLYAAGCSGLILRKRNWQNSESVILKSSAGAYEYLNIYMSEDPGETITLLKQKGIRTYAAMRKDALSYDEVKYTDPVLIAVGGEMRGLSSSVRKQIDQNIYIPYANGFHNALNASSACAVLAYEVFRQRKNCF